jgi:F0F1-type ATP synthase alpha subunit
VGGRPVHAGIPQYITDGQIVLLTDLFFVGTKKVHNARESGDFD